MVKIIYKITNITNGKCYIGQTKQATSTRFRQHISGMGFGKKMPIHLALKKYGKQNFILEELCSCLDETVANYFEAYFINKFNSLVPIGYNVDFNTTFIKDNPYLIEEYNNSLAVQSIGVETDMSEYNTPKRPEYPYQLWKTIIDLYNSGKCPDDINLVLGINIPRCTMVKKLRALGCDTSNKARNILRGRGRYLLSEVEKTNILADFQNGLECVQLEEKYKRGSRTIKQVLVDAGLYFSMDKKICRTLERSKEV